MSGGRHSPEPSRLATESPASPVARRVALSGGTTGIGGNDRADATASCWLTAETDRATSMKLCAVRRPCKKPSESPSTLSALVRPAGYPSGAKHGLLAC